MDEKYKNEPELEYISNFIQEPEQKIVFQHLKKLPFISSEHFMFGSQKKSSVKYLWVSDTGLSYVFGSTMLYPLEAHPFSDYPVLQCIRDYVEGYTGEKFNSVLVNRYEDGMTKLSYHHDDDPWLGDNFIVPSISFGAKRKFLVKQKNTASKNPKTLTYILESGSMVLMGRTMQKYWLHAVPQQKRDLDDCSKNTGLRFNLTFRNINVDLYEKMPKSKSQK